MTYESDPTKQLAVVVSFDPSIDREAMGADFARHFGHVGATVAEGRYGTRDPKLLKYHAGTEPTRFVVKSLRAFERASCDALPTAESRWLSALQYALVHVEVRPPLASEAAAWMPAESNGRVSLEALDWLAERVGIEALYEVGAVAYSRSRLGPFGWAYAPLPATSAHAQALLALSRADTLQETASGTTTTGAAST